jgi:quinol monooxygenase YgiN
VEDDPATVLIYEQYRDAAALEFHRNTPHFHQYAIGGFYQLMLHKEVENLTAIC